MIKAKPFLQLSLDAKTVDDGSGVSQATISMEAE